MSGCSNSNIPQESDLREIFASAFTDCELMKVQNVKKLDGLQLENGKYRVKTSIDVTIQPTEKLAKNWAKFEENKRKYDSVVAERKAAWDAISIEEKEKLARLDEKMKQATQPEERAEILEARKRVEQEAISKQSDISNRASQLLEKMGFTIHGLNENNFYREQEIEFGTVCKLSGKLSKKIAWDFVMALESHERAKLYGQGGACSQTYNLDLTKTEKGWTLYF